MTTIADNHVSCHPLFRDFGFVERRKGQRYPKNELLDLMSLQSALEAGYTYSELGLCTLMHPMWGQPVHAEALVLITPTGRKLPVTRLVDSGDGPNNYILVQHLGFYPMEAS